MKLSFFRVYYVDGDILQGHWGLQRIVSENWTNWDCYLNNEVKESGILDTEFPKHTLLASVSNLF